MKHAAIYLIGFLFLILFGLCSCRAKKSVSTTEERISTAEKIEMVKDSVHIEEKSQTNITTQTDEKENTYVRITDYDSTGTVVRRVQEEWRSTERAELSVLDGSTHHISLESMSAITVSRDSSHTMVNQESEISTDSRPIQGIEWLWVILAVVFFISISVFLYIARKEKWL